MGKISKTDVEILVHIAAPSAGKNDTFYRALTAGYLDFEVANTMKLDHEEEPSYASDEEAESQLWLELSHAALDEVRLRDVNDLIENGDDSYKTSQSASQQLPQRRYLTRSALKNAGTTISSQLSFNSVLDNADSPLLVRGTKKIPATPPPSSRYPAEGVVLSQEASWSTPPSVVEDSQSSYIPAGPEFSSPTSVLEQYRLHFEACRSLPAPKIEVRDNGAQAKTIDEFVRPTPSQLETSIILQTPESVDDPVRLFSSPAERIQQRLISETHKQEAAITAEGVSRLGKRSVSIPARFTQDKAQPSSRSSLDRDDFPSPPRKRRVVSAQTQSYQSALKQLPTLISSPSPQHLNHQFTGRSTRGSSYLSIPSTEPQIPQFVSSGKSLKAVGSQKPAQRPPVVPSSDEIHPPVPLTMSPGFPNTVITPSLAAMSSDPNLSSRYRPRMQTRTLRSLERGYWSISMKDWEPKLRTSAWDSLKSYIGYGKSGWGVWCLRCEEENDKGGIDGCENVDCQERETKVDKGEKGKKVDKVVRVMKTRASGKAEEAGKSREGHAGDGDKVESHDKLTRLRIYCWAEITSHIWLLLYLLSQRRIKASEAKWLDGSGTVVISMV